MSSHPYPKGSYIVGGEKNRRKILEELGDIRFVSFIENEASEKYWETRVSSYAYHVEELKREGWKVEGEEEEIWKPEMNEKYFFVFMNEADARICVRTWGSLADQLNNWNSGNCFKTREEAQLKCDKINQILKER